jgi:hypothetical protein
MQNRWSAINSSTRTASVSADASRPLALGSECVREAIGGFVNERNQAEKPAGAGRNPR